MTDPDGRTPGHYLATELASQPDSWEKAVELAAGQSKLPSAGARVAAVGCGTSWFMAQAYAAQRESSGQGVTDAWAASEAAASPAFIDRGYDAVVAITRSGTTTEVLELVDAIKGRVPVIGIVGDVDTPFVDLVDALIALPFADERSVVQTRFATTALALLRASLGEDLTAVIDQGRAAVAADLPDELVTAEQFTFLGTGRTVGLAHEAALKMREASQAWTESYPAKEYRHGPIAIAAPGRVTWAFGDVPPGLEADTRATGARFEHAAVDGMADLIRAQRVALDRALRAGLDPDVPRNLTRSVVLTGDE